MCEVIPFSLWGKGGGGFEMQAIILTRLEDIIEMENDFGRYDHLEIARERERKCNSFGNKMGK